jgi:hypothetical protein
MTDEAGLIGLLHRADWTRLSLSARLSDGSTVVVAPGKRYRFETAGYVTGCDGRRPWELSDEDDDIDDDDGEVHWICGPEPPVRRLLCPAWLLESSRLEVGGRVRVCGREALDVVASARPDQHGSAEAAIDAELGILLRVVERGSGEEPDVLEMVTADFDPVIDPAIFRAPSGSLRAEGLGEALGGGRLAGSAAKTVAGLAAGALGAWIKHGPQRQGDPPRGPDASAIPDPDPAPAVSPDGRAAGPPVADDVLALLRAGGRGGFSATMHHWIDAGGLASAVPTSARRVGFGGLGHGRGQRARRSRPPDLCAAHGWANPVSD